MSNTSKGKASKGSKYMMQMVASDLQRHILDHKLGEELAWLSPIASTDYEEYQLSEHLACEFIGIEKNKKTFDFWPSRQPQWDGIAIGKETGILYLFEAKSHLSETKSDCSATSESSRKLIHLAMSRVASSEYGMNDSTIFDNYWMKENYQLANRLTFLYHMKQIAPNASFYTDARVVLLNFVNDTTWEEEKRVSNPKEWKKHYDEIFDRMGIKREQVENKGLIEIEYSSPYIY